MTEKPTILFEMVCGVVLPSSKCNKVGYDAFKRATNLHERSVCSDTNWHSLISIAACMSDDGNCPVEVSVI